MDARTGHSGVLEREDTGRKIHRTGHDTREGQNSDMRGGVAAIGTPGVPFLATDTLLGHEIRKSALQAGRHDGFVVVDHDLVARRRLNNMTIVAYAGLGFVELEAVAGADDRRYIAGLDSMDAMRLMVGISIGELVLIVGCVAACLVVAYDLHTEAIGEMGETVHIPVGVGLGEAKMLPVFPSEVPSFGEDGLDIMIVSKLEIAGHIGGSSAMNRSLLPGHGLHMHTPPNTNKLHRTDP